MKHAVADGCAILLALWDPSHPALALTAQTPLLLLPLLAADLILTYYATEAAKWMAADKPSWR